MTTGERRMQWLPSESTTLYMLLASMVGSSLVLCLPPRALAPSELPALRLSREQVRAVIEDDRRAAEAAPRTPLTAELDRLFLEHGEVEKRGTEVLGVYQRRKEALKGAYQRVVASAGETAALALRARAVERFEAALALRLPEEQLTGVMGVFANALESHRAVRGGEEIVPHFVLRTLYKARWNLAMELPAAHALADVELRAFRGFLALHAENLSLPKRLDDLERYAAAGGVRFAEARGVLSFRARDYVAALESFERAYAKNDSLRIRNHLHAARVLLAAEAP